MAMSVPKPDWIAEEERQSQFAKRQAMTKLRAQANALLASSDFREWAMEQMIAVGFFGEGRELTPYQQGRRGGIVEIFERICELADDGNKFIAEVFQRLVKQEEEK